MKAAHPRAPGAVPTEKSASFVRNATYLASLDHQEATRALQQLFLHTHTPVLDFTRRHSTVLTNILSFPLLFPPGFSLFLLDFLFFPLFPLLFPLFFPPGFLSLLREFKFPVR